MTTLNARTPHDLHAHRTAAYLHLKAWRDKVNSVFNCRNAIAKTSTPLLAFRHEMLSSLEDGELLSLSFKLWECDELLKRPGNTPEEEAEIRAKQSAAYQAKCDRVVKSARKTKDAIDAAEHLFSLPQADVAEIKKFTMRFLNIAAESVNHSAVNHNTGDNASAYEQRIHAAFRMLRKANDVLSESRILEKMYNQLGGQGESQ